MITQARSLALNAFFLRSALSSLAALAGTVAVRPLIVVWVPFTLTLTFPVSVNSVTFFLPASRSALSLHPQWRPTWR